MALVSQAPRLSQEEYERNFAEIVPAMNEAEALAESARCLYCFDAPCTRACPTHIDVPAFIKKIHSGNLKGSARVIYQANLFGGSCARVCPVEVLCEGACVYNGMGQRPIQIARLQRHATDHLLRSRIDVLPRLAPHGKRVAAVGGGPGGLSFAGECARYGYDATVFEGRELPGGLNTYGMADYKMTHRMSIEEVERIQALGVQVRTGVWVGKEVSVAELLEDFDAVFLGVGLGGTRRLGIPGEDLEGCIDALHFIEDVKLKPRAEVRVGRRVAVVGAGNTAIDAVTQAKRLGSERVVMVYRRTQREMSAYHYEFEIAKGDQVEFLWQAQPARIEGNGRVERLTCRRTTTGEEVALEVDMVIKAIGQEKRAEWLRAVPGLELDAAGRVAVDAATCRTSVPKLYAGGDCINGGKEAVNAVADGKRAARAAYRHDFGQEPPIL
jgi:glutamate synthase (NADPH/NADH) small chain